MTSDDVHVVVGYRPEGCDWRRVGGVHWISAFVVEYSFLRVSAPSDHAYLRFAKCDNRTMWPGWHGRPGVPPPLSYSILEKSVKLPGISRFSKNRRNAAIHKCHLLLQKMMSLEVLKLESSKMCTCGDNVDQTCFCWARRMTAFTAKP